MLAVCHCCCPKSTTESPSCEFASSVQRVCAWKPSLGVHVEKRPTTITRVSRRDCCLDPG
ncbi:hypothetical protein BKA66DRAFT_466317 [Pyrenochaeta sp. MPI-SDFR-AT-0127]|nr:hypothetical protein BKA66DRAFT_466317 [Pyrenochaeta sp. MPI-SDFR-AT-0127]